MAAAGPTLREGSCPGDHRRAGVLRGGPGEARRRTAAEVLAEHRYRSLRIEVTATELKIVKTIGRGTLPPEVYDLDS